MMKKNSIYLENNNLESKRKDMFQIFINLGHNTLILSETKYNIDSNTYLSELYKYVGNKLEDSGYSNNNYYLTSIGKILPIIDIPISDYGIQNNSNINLDYRLVGGNPLELIVDFFNSLLQLALLIYPGILFIGKLLFWLVQLLM